jgi:antitoxin component YwqK of YwqJK toxin-antitoxin module
MFNSGMKVGDAVWFYKTGPKYRATPYVNGKKEGMQMGFFEDGTVKFEMPFLMENQSRGSKNTTTADNLKRLRT